MTGTPTPTQVQVCVVGHGSNDGTTVSSSGSVANAFFLYAPTSNVTVSSNVSFSGTVVGYDVSIRTLTYSQDIGLTNYPLTSTLGTFHVSQYEQCSATGNSQVLSALLTGTTSSDTSGC